MIMSIEDVYLGRALYELWKIDPKLALEKKFTQDSKKFYLKGKIFVYQSTLGTCGKTRYGCWRYVTREELSKRTFEIEYMEDINIFWTDCLFEPNGNKHIPKEIANVT